MYNEWDEKKNLATQTLEVATLSCFMFSLVNK